MCLGSNAADYDLWGYLTFGRLFWTADGFPYQDIFAYVPTKEVWVYHEWLTGVLYFPIYQSLGEAGLQLLKYALGIMTAGSIYLASRKRGAGPLASVIGLLTAHYLFSIGYKPVRAQVFTFFFYVLTIYILESAKREERWGYLWWLIPIQVLWCNFHDGFVAGLGIIGLYTLGEALSHRRFWPYAKVLVFSCLATLINPYGVKYWGYIIEAISMPRPEIMELLSVYMAIKKGLYVHNVLYFLSFFLFSFLLVLWYRKRDLTDILVLGATAFLSFRHIRHIALFMLSYTIYLPVIFSTFWEVFKGHPWKIAFRRHLDENRLMLLVAILTVFLTYRFLSGSPFDIRTRPSQDVQGKHLRYPIGAVEYMKAHNLTGNVLLYFDWGEFIIWTFTQTPAWPWTVATRRCIRTSYVRNISISSMAEMIGERF